MLWLFANVVVRRYRSVGGKNRRWYLVYGSSGTGSWGRTYGGVISSVVNAIQIQVLNAIYKKIAVALTGT